MDRALGRAFAHSLQGALLLQAMHDGTRISRRCFTRDTAVYRRFPQEADMSRDKEAQPISILLFILGIASAFVVFFVFVGLQSGTATRFAQRADNWQIVTQLYRQEDSVRNLRDL
jgi:hypothetical protein